MKPFWRTQPVIGRWLNRGQGLIVIPDYMSRTSFPYLKRPFAKEVPFADDLIVVRPLGGWNEQIHKGEANGSRKADLLYRDKQGKIRYRWHLLAPRLDPYITAGYNRLTIVLDNTPWALPAKPHPEYFGQAAPPENRQEWGQFVEALCEQLVRLYGYERVNSWRFRQGTECQSRDRFFGTQEAYLQQYDASAAAIKRILPDAKFGPFNQAGGKNRTEKNSIDYLSVVKHSLLAAPPDFVAVSSYYTSITRDKGGTPGFIRRAQANIGFFDAVKSLDKRVASLPEEVHEFGIIDYVRGAGKTDQPGAYGAALRFYIMMEMRKNGLSRLAHWNVFQKFPSREPQYLLKGEGWLYAILEHMRDASAMLQSVSARQSNTYYQILAAETKVRYYLLIGSLHSNPTFCGSEKLHLELPKTWLGKLKKRSIQKTELSRDNAVFCIIRNDLLKTGLLSVPYRKSRYIVGSIRAMTNARGWSFLNSRWKNYEEKMVQSLTLKNFPGDIRNGQLDLEVKIPGLTLVVLEKSHSSSSMANNTSAHSLQATNQGFIK